ncbi:hypothetical protein KCP69_21695 [Salmonella enterica subsp. enterica]|nr:hypothetical protein KCP69_21695 [Salmonella enterica subsp. enterica]
MSVISPDVKAALFKQRGVAPESRGYAAGPSDVSATLLPLLTPRLLVPPQPRENPFIALLAVFCFARQSCLSAGNKSLAFW